MSTALRSREPPARRLTRNEQLEEVSREAENIWQRHRNGEITSDVAAAELAELKMRYRSLFDRLLDL